MADLKLRDYQQAAIEEVRAHWAAGRKRVLCWLPTGAGKTELSAALALAEQQRGGSTLFVVDRKTLAGQTRNRFSGRYGMLTGLLRGEETFVRGYEPVTVASVQTLKARHVHPEVKGVLDRATLCVIDEAHIRHQHHDDLLDMLPNARVLGLTATPLRDGLGRTFGAMVRGPSYADLIGRGFLVPPRYFLPGLDAIRDGLRSISVASTGDYTSDELSQLMRGRVILGDAVSTWQAKAEGRATIAFCVDVAHSKAMADAFLSAGVPAEHIDFRTEEADRAGMFERLRRGTTRVLCSVAVLAIGFDEPVAACAILARPTLSLALHIQQIGRVMRPSAGKIDCIVLDHAANVLRHGKVEEFTPPELSNIDARSDLQRKNEPTRDYFPCPACNAVMIPGQRQCGECGHEIARATDVHHVEADLTEAPTTAKPEMDFQTLYRELTFIAKARGHKPGWAYFKLRENYGFSAPTAWKNLPPLPPCAATERLDKSWRIAWAKTREKERQA